MKKTVFILCIIILFGCSKKDVIPTPLSNDAEISHICNDDLVLVNGLIQLKISKEEAIYRGVPAPEYDLIEETLSKHNNNTIDLRTKNEIGSIKTKTTRSGNTMAWGMLQDPPSSYYNNVSNIIPLSVSNEGNENGITLNYSFGSYNVSDFATHKLEYSIVGPTPLWGEIEGYDYSMGDYPFPGLSFGWMTLRYSYSGPTYGICVYQIFDNT